MFLLPFVLFLSLCVSLSLLGMICTQLLLQIGSHIGRFEILTHTILTSYIVQFSSDRSSSTNITHITSHHRNSQMHFIICICIICFMCATILMRFCLFRARTHSNRFVSSSLGVSVFTIRLSLHIQYIRAFYSCPIDCVTFHFESIGLKQTRKLQKYSKWQCAHTHAHSKQKS